MSTTDHPFIPAASQFFDAAGIPLGSLLRDSLRVEAWSNTSVQLRAEAVVVVPIEAWQQAVSDAMTGTLEVTASIGEPTIIATA